MIISSETINNSNSNSTSPEADAAPETPLFGGIDDELTKIQVLFVITN